MITSIGSSFVLHETGKQYSWKGTAPLSVKTFFGGSVLYNIGSGRYLVDEGTYLVINSGTEYEIEINSPKTIESFCIFFSDELVQDIVRCRSGEARHLLDEPHGPQRVSFVERTFRNDPLLFPSLINLRNQMRIAWPQSGWIEEQLHDLFEELLQLHIDIHKEADKLHSVRFSTREELYKRLWRARDFLEASVEDAVNLQEIARVACLSPNHLLRTFRQLFGDSPHQMLTRRRLERAEKLLRTSDLPVTEICFGCGFESPGSFSSLFKKFYGCSPKQYRDSLVKPSEYPAVVQERYCRR